MNSLLCPSQVPSTGDPPPRAPAAKPAPAAPKAPSEKVLSTISRTPSGKPNLVTFFADINENWCMRMLVFWDVFGLFWMLWFYDILFITR